MLATPIPVRMLTMDGTSIDADGMLEVRANRSVNVESGLPPIGKDRSLKGRAAIVGYGPSLNATWERLREFDVIWTVSKAHDFLIERGITPTHHVDLDPRPHKTGFMGRPTAGVHYFLSTHIHPSYIEKMKGAALAPELFHVAIDKHERLDARYPSAKARYDAGIQAAELAYQRGHREQHWFGIDYGAVGGQTHAGHHGGVTSEGCRMDVDGRMFESTQLFIHGLLLAEYFLCDRALVRATIHGDGLLGHFLRARGRTKISVVR